MDFPTRLKELRTEGKLTQEQLGEKINVTKVSISGYESGNRKPDIETLQRIADFFNVSVDFLLGKTDQRDGVESTGGRAYYGGGSDWTEEEKAAADAFIEMLRARKRQEKK